MLTDVLDVLRCPVCALPLSMLEQVLRCDRGHSFDVARQGYVSLLTGREALGSADTAAMVEHRARLLGTRMYEGIARAVAAASGAAFARERGPTAQPVVLEVGAGTGYYLDAVLRELGSGRGLALDLSKSALRRAARLPHVGAVVTDVWRPFPIADGAVDLALCVFAPRNAEQLHRVLRPTGSLVVVTPAAEHLAELVSRLDLLRVDERKAERLAEQLGGAFVQLAVEQHDVVRTMSRRDVVDVVGMGPSAFHTSPETLAAAAAELPEQLDVTLSVRVSTWQPR